MSWPHKKDLLFKASSKSLSLGIELELQVLDADSLRLAPRAADIIRAFNDDRLVKEMFQSTLEINTLPCENVHNLKADLQPILLELIRRSQELGVRFASTGTHPIEDYRNRLVTSDSRYLALADSFQWIIRRMAVYGMHIHFGMTSGDESIEYMNFFMYFLPHLVALSASSPFWRGASTGLASTRLTMYESLPTAAVPYPVTGWKEFQDLFRNLIRSEAIQSAKDLWWDVRPSPYNGTVELRFCDEPASLREVLGIAAFAHLLAFWFRDHKDEWHKSSHTTKGWILRENKWRAIRQGLDASIVISESGKTAPLADEILTWLSKLEAYNREKSYDPYLAIIYDLLTRGNSASRQVQVHEQSGDLLAVIRHNVSEFESFEPRWPTMT